jgi:hypothetical protein
MSNDKTVPGLRIALRQDAVEITHGDRTALIDRDIWPPAWDVEALDAEVAQGIVSWFRATEQAPRRYVTPIEIVLQMVLNYLNIDAADPPPAVSVTQPPAQSRGAYDPPSSQKSKKLNQL